MVITKLIIYKSNRLKLLKKKEFTLIPKANVEILTGPSGIGKSTIMEYLLPWPIDKSDFNPGGYRELHITYNNNEYVVTSNSKGEHSITKNGISVCKGTTRKEYIHTIEEEFSLSMFLFKILTGKIAFTSISPSMRKEWVSLISPVNLSFAYKFYENVKSDLRDLNGSKKITESKLSDFSYTDEEEKTIKRLKAERDSLLFIKDHLLKRNYSELDSTVLEKIKTLVSSIKTALRKLKDYDEYKALERFENKLARMNTLIDTVKSKIEHLKKTTSFDIEELSRKIKDLQYRCNEIESINYLNIAVDNISSLYGYINSKDVSTVLEELRNSEVDITGIDEFTMAYGQIKMKRETLKKDIDVLNGEILGLRDAKNNNDVLCPKCGTSFNPNYSEEKMKYKERELAKKRKNFERVDRLYKKLEEMDGKLRNRINAYKWLKSFFLGDTELTRISRNKGLFKNENEEAEILDNDLPEKLDSLLTDVIVYLNKSKDLPVLCNRLTEYEVKYKTISGINEKIITDNKKRLERYNHQLNRLYRLRKIYLDKVDEKKREESLRAKLNREYQQLEALKEYKTTYDEYRENLPIRIMSKYVVDKVTILLKEIEKEISDIQSRKDRVTTYIAILEETNNKIAILEELLRVMDPRTGLIARSIESSLGVILNSVNSILEETFFYPIRVTMDRSNIDYKFGLVIDNAEGKQDISMGSSGQKEIVDFAFLLTTYMLLKLPFPILLDEIGHRIDPVNRQRLFNYIMKIEELYPNQIFMVSHNEFNQTNSSRIHVIKL